jgi:hypothetical protein
VITAINIALLGVVLAAVALVIMRRRRSGATDEVVSEETPEDTLAPVAAIEGDVFSKHVWAEAAATLTPVREDQEEAVADADDEAEPEAEYLDARGGEQKEYTGEIAGLGRPGEPEATTRPDDGFAEIITEPGWYLPGEVDMSWEGPGAETGLLAPETDLVTAAGDLGDERGLGSSAPLLAEGTGGFDPELGGNDMTWQSLGAETGLLAAEADRVISSEDLDEEPGLAAEAYSAPVPADGTVGFDPEPGANGLPPEAAQSAPSPRPTAPRRSSRSNRRRAVIAGTGAGALGILLAAVIAWNAVKDEPGTGTPAAAATPAAVSAPAAASARGRSEVIASLREVDAAAARDDTDSARRILGSIDPAVLKADPGLALQARIMRNRVQFTESYLAATALADAGRYGEARERMLALVPFRDAGVRSRLYGVEIAKGLVAQARSEAAVHPARALVLLDRAEDIAPSLSAIRAVRAEIGP